MKILDFWPRGRPDQVSTLLVVEGRVMCRRPNGVVGSTVWLSEAQVREEFADLNRNVDYKWYHRCARRKA